MGQEPRILLTGASGFVGWNLLGEMRRRGLSPVALVHRTSLEMNDIDQFTGDLCCRAEMARAINQTRPDSIIHCAALTNAAACEQHPELASDVNVAGTRHLLASAPKATRFIFLSTDLVFDGTRGNYTEADPPHPHNCYARTKFGAEEAVRTAIANHVILRSALVYGPRAPHHASFLAWMHEGCRNGRLALFSDEYRTPVYVGDLAKLLLQLAGSDFCGTVHAGGPERLSRHQFGLHFCRTFGYAPETLEQKRLSQNKTGVYRPRDVSLNIELARSKFGYRPLGVAEGLSRTKALEETGAAGSS